MEELQKKQAEVNSLCGFKSKLVGLGLGISAETGELVDYLAKIEGLKKPKPTDDMSNLREKVADECADVLVYLLQIANELDFDLREVYLKKCKKLLDRHVPLLKA